MKHTLKLFALGGALVLGFNGCGDDPVTANTVPSGLSSTDPYSFAPSGPAMPVIST